MESREKKQPRSRKGATNIKRNKTICVFVKKLDSTILYLAGGRPEYLVVRYS